MRARSSHLAFVLFILVFSGCASSSSGVSAAGDASLSFAEETRISNLRQLTFEGTNAEAYWSYDGRYLTYQHSGEGAKCDQIFRMNADGKNKVRISNGQGRTTCSFFTPDDDYIVYSSTHASSKACPAEADKSKSYAWPASPTYHFYRSTFDGKDVVPIEPGAPSAYNAELVTCKDGKVIFTSDRGGDLDLYTGRLDSKGMIVDVKQLTKTLGYDGGAFFSQDCSKIIWRASRPKPGREAEEYVDLLRRHLVRPSELEIWTANADGSNAKQVTKLGGASFAPYFTPDASHILFSSNWEKPGSRNFNIYMIRSNGTELEQVTHSGTFDSFPMFSPDGKYLAFSSNRNARKPRETNVFIADWNSRIAGPIMTDEEKNPVNRWYVVARELSAPDMEGRGVGTSGLNRAEAYVAELFQKAGLAETSSTFGFGEAVKGYEHEVEIVRGVELDEGTSLKADWRKLKVKDEFAPAAFSAQGSVSGKIFDVGYGIIAPELSIDDYEGKNVKGRIVLVRRRVPVGLKLSPAQESTYGDLRYKAFLARERGAVGVVFWEPEGDEKKKEDLMENLRSSDSSVASDAGIPVLFASRKIVREWLSATKPVTLSGKIALEHRKISANNIVGFLGSEESCRSGRPVVIGAHLDHLGGGGENSLEPAYTRVTHPGADDNASGVATLIETARSLKARKAPGCYLFVAFTAEESGIIGSSRFVDLLKSKKIRPKAMLNMDMVGRMTNNEVSIFGANSATEWKKIVRRQCERNVLMCQAGGDGYGPSDHMPFYIARVPVLHFFTGAHADYHRASDTYEKLNPVGGVQIAELVADIAAEAGDRKTLLTYVKASGKNTMSVIRRSRGGRSGAYLGTIPNYSEMTGKVKANTPDGAREVDAPKGVLLSGVREKSPASEAGIREGDIITGMIILDEEPGFAAAHPKTTKIQNLQDYTYVLSNLKPGMRVKIQIWRKGDSLELPATIGRK